jgi:hypothetical protein
MVRVEMFLETRQTHFYQRKGSVLFSLVQLRLVEWKNPFHEIFSWMNFVNLHLLLNGCKNIILAVEHEKYVLLFLFLAFKCDKSWFFLKNLCLLNALMNSVAISSFSVDKFKINYSGSIGIIFLCNVEKMSDSSPPCNLIG